MPEKFYSELKKEKPLRINPPGGKGNGPVSENQGHAQQKKTGGRDGSLCQSTCHALHGFFNIFPGVKGADTDIPLTTVAKSLTRGTDNACPLEQQIKKIP